MMPRIHGGNNGLSFGDVVDLAIAYASGEIDEHKVNVLSGLDGPAALAVHEQLAGVLMAILVGRTWPASADGNLTALRRQSVARARCLWTVRRPNRREEPGPEAALETGGDDDAADG